MKIQYCFQLEGQVVALLVQNLDRLDEAVKEEGDGVHNTLGKQTPCFSETSFTLNLSKLENL